MDNFSTPEIPCPKHPHEPLKRVDMSSGAESELLCIECIVDDPTLYDKKFLKNIDEFLNIASSFYSKGTSAEDTRRPSERPEKFENILATQHTSFESIKAKIEAQKAKVVNKFNEILINVTKQINKQQQIYLDLLDKQLVNFEYNYQYLDKQLRKAYPSDEDHEALCPNKQQLQSRLSKVSNFPQFRGFIRNIMDDLNETKQISEMESSEDTTLNKEEFCSIIGDKILQNLKNDIKILDSTIDNDVLFEKINGNLEGNINAFFELQNSIESIKQDQCSIKGLKSNDVQTIKNWLPKKAKSKKWKVNYDLKKDGWGKYVEKTKGSEHSLVIFFSGKNVFGGYMDQDWGKYNGYFNSDEAFLFSVNNKKKYEKTMPQCAYFDQGTYGLCFGDSLYTQLSSQYGYCYPYTNYTCQSAQELSGGETFTIDQILIIHLK